MNRLLAALALVLAAAACGGSDTAAAPTIAIFSPAAGSQQSLATDGHVDIAFTSPNFTFEPACPSQTSGNCGHVHVLIDGADCNPAGGQPYNNSATSTPAKALFNTCSHQTGSHTVTLELHHSDHTSIKGGNGSTVASSVSFTTL